MRFFANVLFSPEAYQDKLAEFSRIQYPAEIHVLGFLLQDLLQNLSSWFSPDDTFI